MKFKELLKGSVYETEKKILEETEEEVKAYAIQNLYEDDGGFVDALDYFVTGAELLNWIIENPTVLEKFKEDYAEIIKVAEKRYAKEYLALYCEEVED